MIKLSNISTKAPKDYNKSKIKSETKELTKKIAHLQHLMYAEGKKSLLIIFQGMDASGKDGVTRKVFKKCSPVGVSASAYKKPTEEEFAHDFLWRIHQDTPQKGKIQIFNRSHYEDILVQKVHNWIDDNQRTKRMAAINQFEELLQFDNNTIILKFYMHLSEEKQLEKLQERIDDPTKNWKHNDRDWEERKYWAQYMEAYEYAINNSKIPWHIIPVDSRTYRDYCIAKVIEETLSKLNLTLPLIEKK